MLINYCFCSWAICISPMFITAYLLVKESSACWFIESFLRLEFCFIFSLLFNKAALKDVFYSSILEFNSCTFCMYWCPIKFLDGDGLLSRLSELFDKVLNLFFMGAIDAAFISCYYCFLILLILLKASSIGAVFLKRALWALPSAFLVPLACLYFFSSWGRTFYLLAPYFSICVELPCLLRLLSISKNIYDYA